MPFIQLHGFVWRNQRELYEEVEARKSIEKEGGGDSQRRPNSCKPTPAVQVLQEQEQEQEQEPEQPTPKHSKRWSDEERKLVVGEVIARGIDLNPASGVAFSKAAWAWAPDVLEGRTSSTVSGEMANRGRR